jgi:hypothetical protein
MHAILIFTAVVFGAAICEQLWRQRGRRRRRQQQQCEDWSEEGQGPLRW